MFTDCKFVQKRSVLQDWVQELTFMQQSVLLTAVRGPDGATKYGSIKMLLRWYRRCVLISAFDGSVLTDPCDSRGGSFTGPSIQAAEGNPDDWQKLMDLKVDDYIREMDAIPLHFHNHFMHAAEILGYKHPEPDIRQWWNKVYVRFAHSFHLYPESEEQMDARLGDRREGWLARSDKATVS